MLSYQKWKKSLIDKAFEETKMITTSAGKILYSDIGKGFPVIHSHGSPTSADSGVRAFSKIAELAGFRLITPARPGFLKTSLSVGQSIEQQADMFTR